MIFRRGDSGNEFQSSSRDSIGDSCGLIGSQTVRKIAIGLVCTFLLGMWIPQANAAKTKGTVRVLCIRVNFKDKKGAPSDASVRSRMRSAKFNFERFSYGRMTLNYTITPAVTLNRNRSFYSGSGLASAAEVKAARRKTAGKSRKLIMRSP